MSNKQRHITTSKPSVDQTKIRIPYYRSFNGGKLNNCETLETNKVEKFIKCNSDANLLFAEPSPLRIAEESTPDELRRARDRQVSSDYLSKHRYSRFLRKHPAKGIAPTVPGGRDKSLVPSSAEVIHDQPVIKVMAPFPRNDEDDSLHTSNEPSTTATGISSQHSFDHVPLGSKAANSTSLLRTYTSQPVKSEFYVPAPREYTSTRHRGQPSSLEETVLSVISPFNDKSCVFSTRRQDPSPCSSGGPRNPGEKVSTPKRSGNHLASQQQSLVHVSSKSEMKRESEVVPTLSITKRNRQSQSSSNISQVRSPHMRATSLSKSGVRLISKKWQVLQQKFDLLSGKSIEATSSNNCSSPNAKALLPTELKNLKSLPTGCGVLQYGKVNVNGGVDLAGVCWQEDSLLKLISELTLRLEVA